MQASEWDRRQSDHRHPHPDNFVFLVFLILLRRSSSAFACISCFTSSLTIACDLMLLIAHVRWLQTGPTYKRKCWSCKISRFLTHEKAASLLTNLVITSELVRAGRALLRWEQRHLAE